MPGLSHLSESEQRSALEVHGDFYEQRGERVSPRLSDGRFRIGSMHAAGFGFAVRPDLDAWQPADQWQYESLGLN